MQHSPEVDLVTLFDVEDQVRVTGQRTASQTGQIEFVLKLERPQ